MLVVVLALSCVARVVCARGEERAQVPAVSLELRVERAIARGLSWSKSKQAKDGSFPGQEAAHPGGETALASLAMVKSGVSRSDPALMGGLAALSRVEMKSTYSAAVYLMLVEALGEKQPALDAAKKCLAFLVANQREGLWGYPAEPRDMSNTQFALLGLRAARDLGLDVPRKTLDEAATALLVLQDAGEKKERGFPYREGGAPTGGMTAATLAGLALLEDLGRGDALLEAELKKRAKDIADAEAYLARTFSGERNAYGSTGWTPSFHYAYLWAVERWCGFAKKERIGAHDWYREGAEFLLAAQRADGGWGRSLDDTCFALLFLRRATVTGYEDLSGVYTQLDDEKRAEQEKPKIAPAADVPRLTDWLIAGPLLDKRGNPLLTDGSLREERLQPREKQKVEGRAFARFTLKPDGWTNLEELTGQGGDLVTWIAATNLFYSPGPGGEKLPLEATLWFAFEDGWKVLLDGQTISHESRAQAPIEESVEVPIELAPGAHTLVVLVADDQGASAFGARITDRAGRALPSSFRSSADPSERAKSSPAERTKSAPEKKKP